MVAIFLAIMQYMEGEKPQFETIPEELSDKKEKKPHKNPRSKTRKMLEASKNVLKRKFNPSEYIRESIPYIDELSPCKEELAWIVQVKNMSLDYKKEHPNEETVTTFDLVNVHLMLQRDWKLSQDPKEAISRKREFHRARTEESLEKVISGVMQMVSTSKYMASEFSGYYLSDNPVTLVEYTEHLFKNLDTMNMEEKASTLTKWLNVYHQGGSNMTLGLIRGIPSDHNPYNSPPWSVQSEKNFLYKLNNLGNVEGWKRVEKAEAEVRKESRTNPFKL